MSSPPTSANQLIDLDLPYVDFIPPGFELDPRRIPQLANSFSSAYSRLHNQRRYEAPFYGPWDILLNAVFDGLIPRMAINGQYTFTSLRDETMDTSCDSDIPRERRNQHLAETRKRVAKAEKRRIFPSSDGESDGTSAFGGESASEEGHALTEDSERSGMDDVDVDSLQSTEAAAEAVEKGKAKATDPGDKPKAGDIKTPLNRAATAIEIKRIPDFVVELYPRMQSRANPKKVYPDFTITDYTCWDDVKIPEVIIPSLWELKKPPSRSLPTSRFFDELDKELKKASIELLEETPLAFLSQPTLKSIILVAIAGEWWMWKIKERPNNRELTRLLSSMPVESVEKKKRGSAEVHLTRSEHTSGADTDADDSSSGYYDVNDLSYVDDGLPSDDSGLDLTNPKKSPRPVRRARGHLFPQEPESGHIQPPTSVSTDESSGDDQDDEHSSVGPTNLEDEPHQTGEGEGGASEGDDEVEPEVTVGQEGETVDDLSETESDVSGFQRHKDDQHDLTIPAFPSLKALEAHMLGLPAETWTVPMRLGTEQSNQAFALIVSMHERFLQNINSFQAGTPSPTVPDVEENEPGPSNPRGRRRGRRN